MTTIEIIFLCILQFLLPQHAIGQGQWDIELSPQSVASVPFGDGFISVWEHAKTKGRYYAIPLAYLAKERARAIQNIITDTNEMLFDVVLWSDPAREAVWRYLHSSINTNIKEDAVEMLPMEKIRVVWKNRLRPLSSRFQLDDEWKSNARLQRMVTFKFTCSAESSCHQLAEVMKTSPQMFDAMEFEYVINGQKSASRSLSLTGQHLVQGQLYTKLNQMQQGSSSSDLYLNIDDVKRMSSESVSTVISSTIRDTDYVDTGDELRLNDLMERHLKRQEVSTDNFRPHMWDSVFWDPIWTRPDKLTSSMNKLFKKDTSDSEKFTLDKSSDSDSNSASASFGFGPISAGVSASRSSSSSSHAEKKDVLKKLHELSDHVEWTGEVFRTKPMKLYRQNLSQLRSKTKIVSANVQVSRYESVHSIKVWLGTGANSSMMTGVTAQLVEARLKDALKKSEAKFSGKLSGVDNRMKSAEGKLSRLPGGAIYVRWGRTVCPVDAELVYKGFVGGGHSSREGSGSNYVCLSEDPKYTNTKPDVSGAVICGTKFQGNGLFLTFNSNPNDLIQSDVLCAVCRSSTKTSSVMIPGTNVCPNSDWNKEYWGYLMTAHNNDKAQHDFVCVDNAPEKGTEDGYKYDGAQMWHVQGKCGLLPCQPYKKDVMLTCVMCTK